MSADRLLLSYLAIGLEATLLAAIVRRRHYKACLSFPLYVVAVFLPSLVFAVWPKTFTWESYVLREIVHNLLKFAIALELAYRTFRAFPSAMSTARRILLLLLVVIAVVTLGALLPARNPGDIDIESHARILNGTIWVFTAIAAMILWYRLPVHPFHKAILVGFVPYLLVFSLGLQALVEMGEKARWLQRTHTLAYVALLLYWNRAAWSRAPALVASPRHAHQARQPEPA